MPDDANSSVYSRLDHTKSHVRLLHLQPRLDDKGKICCSLSLDTLDKETCKYEALSYEWGDASDALHHIRLDGTKFAVTGNLWLALYHLRDRDSIRILWIDALCINQANEGERNHQVRHMGSIYQRATQVIAWIGPSIQKKPKENYPASSVENVLKASEFAQLLYGRSKLSRYYYGARAPGPPWIPDPAWIPHQPSSNLSNIYSDDPRWGNLYRVMRRSYFGRLWIIQELILASRVIVQFGNVTLNFAVLEHILGQEYHAGILNRTMPGQAFSTAAPAARILGRTTPFKLAQQRFQIRSPDYKLHSIFDLCYRYREAACADPRDKIFALLGMSQQCCQNAVEVDYSKPPMEICHIMIDHQLRCHDSHDLKFEDHTHHRIRELFNIVRANFTMFEGETENLKLPTLFTNSCSSETVAMLGCRLIGNITTLNSDQWSSRAHTIHFSAGMSATEGSVTESFIEVKVGDCVFGLNSYEVIILRPISDGLLHVGFGFLRHELSEQDSVGQESTIDFLFMGIESLQSFCRDSAENARCMLVSLFCRLCKDCNDRRFRFDL